MILRDLGLVANYPGLYAALHSGSGPAALHLSPRLSAALEDSDTRTALKSELATTGNSLRAAVLEAGDLPGWSRPYRAALAVGAAELLADVNPQRTRLWVIVRVRPEAGLNYLIRVAAFCHDLHVQTRRVVCVSPAGAAPELAAALAAPEAVEAMAGLAGITRDQAVTALETHIAFADPTPEGLALPGGGGEEGALLTGWRDEA